MPPIDLERRWAPFGACRGHRTEMFFPPAGPVGKKPSKGLQRQWDEAKQICQRCPVLNQCRRDTLGEMHGVWGGLDEFQRYLIRRALPKAAKNWPPARRLALGRMLHNLRSKLEPDDPRSPRVSWTAVREMTGIGPELGQQLINEYVAHQKAIEAKRKTKIVDLPLPERPPLEFPNRPGKRDMWVRNNGIIADGAYRGESVNGAWILAEVPNGRHHTQKWVRVSDVKFHRHVPRYVVSDKERVA